MKPTKRLPVVLGLALGLVSLVGSSASAGPVEDATASLPTSDVSSSGVACAMTTQANGKNLWRFSQPAIDEAIALAQCSQINADRGVLVYSVTIKIQFQSSFDNASWADITYPSASATCIQNMIAAGELRCGHLDSYIQGDWENHDLPWGYHRAVIELTSSEGNELTHISPSWSMVPVPMLPTS